MSKNAQIFTLLFVASLLGLVLLINVPFLQYSTELLWHVPYRSFVIMLVLVLVSCCGKLIAEHTFYQQSIANLGLYVALSWFPASLIFSGNVRNIFSTSSLVSYDTWLVFSFLPVALTLLLMVIKLITNIIKD